MNYLELVDEYLRVRFGERKVSYAKRVRRYITRSIEHFNGAGILTPSERDFQDLEAWASTQIKSVASVREWVREATNFYEWILTRRQITMFEDEQVQEREGLQNEPETPAVNDDTSTVQEEATAILEQPQIAPVNHECAVQCDELQCGSPVNEKEHTPITEDEQPQTQPRRGRRPKNEQERRSVKLSIYLTPKLYEGLKFLASAKGEDISDVVFTQLEDFVVRNSENVKNIRNFFASLGAIK